jgi:hypothetical protein
MNAAPRSQNRDCMSIVSPSPLNEERDGVRGEMVRKTANYLGAPTCPSEMRPWPQWTCSSGWFCQRSSEYEQFQRADRFDFMD